MPINADRFLERYALVLNAFDPKKAASFCLTPTVMMNDADKLVATSEDKLEKVFSEIFTRLKRAGVRTFVPKLQQTMRLSDTLFFSKMRWQFYDEQEQLCFTCAASYTLQSVSDDQLKIIVVVIDDDENKLADIFNVTE